MYNAPSFQRSVERFNFRSEDDDNVRTCTVSLYIREIAGSAAHHWALYFDWGDYKATYEANNEGGTLTPMWNKGKPINLEGTSSEMKKLGERSISPQHVNHWAKNNKLNGKKYSVSNNNCQHWVKELASEINFQLQMGEAEIVKAVAGGSAGSLASVSAVSSLANNKSIVD